MNDLLKKAIATEMLRQFMIGYYLAQGREPFRVFAEDELQRELTYNDDALKEHIEAIDEILKG